MKKYGIGSRVLTGLLVLAMVVSMIPSSIFAALGDKSDGDTGIVSDANGNISTNDTISLPIKIYDYLNDGMLFEYAEGSDQLKASGGYGGGYPEPDMPTYYYTYINPTIENNTGNGESVYSSFDEEAYTYWAATRLTHSKAYQRNFADFVDVGHMHIEYTGTEGYRPHLMLADYGLDNGYNVPKDDVRYVVLVYRTGGGYDQATLRMDVFADSSSTFSGTNAMSASKHYNGAPVQVPASEEWTYLVYDLKTNNTSLYPFLGDTATGYTGDNWGNFSHISGIGCVMPLNETGETMDIAYVAFYGDKSKAESFGESAALFCSNPGQDLYKAGYSGGTKMPANVYNDLIYDYTTTAGYNMGFYGTTNSLGNANWIGSTAVSATTTSPKYLRLTENGTDYDTAYIAKFGSDFGYYPAKEDMQYVLMVYKTSGITETEASDRGIGFWVEGTTINVGAGSRNYAVYEFKASSGWTYAVYNLGGALATADGDWSKNSTIMNVGMYFPGLYSGEQLDVSHIGFFSSSEAAAAYGAAAVAFNKNPGTYSSTGFGWINSNNKAFGLLRSSNLNSLNAYKTYYVGKDYFGDIMGKDNADNEGKYIYHMNMYDANSAEKAGYEIEGLTINRDSDGKAIGATYDMSNLTLKSSEGEYKLLTTITDHKTLFTVGLTEATLNADKTLQYREETVDYVAELLRNTLIIPRVNNVGSSNLGWYNYNYVSGTPSETYGGVDLATALRSVLTKVTVDQATAEKAFGYTYNYADAYKLGTYADTLAKKDNLVGKWADVKGSIKTCYDAAYFLLNSIFVEESYNTPQDTYDYLILSKAQMENGEDAFVFDAGFTVNNADATDTVSAVYYDAANKTISLKAADGSDLSTVYKTLYDYDGQGNLTTYCPFLPVHNTSNGSLIMKDGTTATGGVAGTISQDKTVSPYPDDDCVPNMKMDSSGTYTNANFNYVMASNGEFVYHYDENLFFEFEGDDDVYLYINNQLVLDIGGAHSISKVRFDLNAYVNEARKNIAAAKANNQEPTARDLALALVDGQTYDFDFYYMERHGVGANFRVATNIVVTDPALKTNKQGYQGTDINGDPEEVLYGGIIDINDRIGYSFSITNEGDTKLYKLGFEDGDIGINLTYDGGLQVYGAATNATFTTTADSTAVTISGLNGVVSLDGEAKFMNTGAPLELTVAAGTHTLALYQLNDGSDPTHWNPLFTDAKVTVKIGTSDTAVTPTVTDGVYTLAAGSNILTVAGIRVSDKNGGHLEVNDLTITVDGFTPEVDADGNRIEPYNLIATPTYTIKLDKEVTEGETTVMDHAQNQADLKSFLETLVDPDHQTGETNNNDLYSGDGLWHKATVKISGFYYTMTEAQKEANRFTNTVFTSGYKYKDATTPIKSQDRHRVYGLGSYEYYQWASHTVHLDLKTMWDDVVNVYTRPDDSLYEQRDQIEKLVEAGLSTLQVEITDKNGVALKDTYNLYANENWGTYEPTAADKTKLAELVADWDEDTNGYAADMDHVFYFQKDAPEEGDTESWNQNWQNVWVYYWSDTNTGLTTWPGKQMYQLNDTTWCYFLHPEAENVVFSNGSGGYNNQTGDLVLPETAFTAVDWNDTNDVLEVTYKTSGRHIFYVKVTSSNSAYYQQVIVPIVFYVSDVKDNYYVLDYGLKTETINANTLLANDDFLANYGLTKAEFVGYLSDANKPRYLGTYSSAAFNLKNINRVAYDGSLLTGSSIAVNDGTFNIGTTAASTITYTVTDGIGSYSMPSGYTVSFTPSKIMDEEYNMYMAFRVYNKVTEKLVDGVKVETEFEPNAIGDENVTGAIDHVIDIHNEVQMYKKITMLPATVVYYEDDFADITYTKNYGTFTQLGTVSTNLTQGIDGQTPYGQDSTYQGSTNDEMSGNTLTGIKLENENDKGVVASFNFTGTGFEIISRTNSYDSASLVVNVYSAALDKDGNIVKASTTPINKLPVITEFTNVEGNVCQHADHTTDGACKTCGINVAHSYEEAVGSTMYHFTVNGKPENFIFNNGGNGSQTADLSYDSTKAGVWSDEIEVNGVTIKYMVVDHDENSRTFYVDFISGSWSKVCLHAWTGETNYTGGNWPGVAMSLAYYCTVSENAVNVIFNNGSGGDQNQTADMTLEADGEWHSVTSKIGAPVGQYLAESATTNGQRGVYFASSGIWSAVSIYAWGTDGTNYTGSWPGNSISKSCSVCGAPYKATADYYLVGYINKNDNYGTDYGFVNGTLTATFTDDTYVHVQSSNGNQYWTPGYPGDEATSSVMYVGAEYADKLRVPVGVQVTFTLLENPDGSVTLSYAPTIVIEDETDVTAGPEMTLTSNTVIYYDNSTTRWETVKIYAWNDSTGTKYTGEWSGSQMNRIGNTDIYYFEVPAGADRVIFNNGSGAQTDDLKFHENVNCYANSAWTYYEAADSEDYEIYQVPVIRVDSMPYGTYVVEIEGMPTLDFTNMSIDGSGNVTGVEVVPTTLYIDGIRIFQPLGSSHSQYYKNENLATFTELRDLILDGNAAVAVFDKSTNIYTGNKSWTENRNGELYVPSNGSFTTVEYIGNMVSSVDQYMLVGPNNEAYLNGINTNQSVIFYVAEEAVTYHSVQIAARAIDAGLFLNGEAAGTGATLYQGIKSGNSYAWKSIGNVHSSTEQYYTIDYAACPTVELNGKNYYQVALHVSGGMVSFSTVKLVGMTIAENDFKADATSLKYTANGMLEDYQTSTETEQAALVWNLFTISRQMEAEVQEDANNGGNTGNGGNNDSNAPTGDVSLLIPAGLMIMALMCLAFVATRKKAF